MRRIIFVFFAIILVSVGVLFLPKHITHYVLGLFERQKSVSAPGKISLEILTPFSHPTAGENWRVLFKTEGKSEIIVSPDDEATRADLDFVSLKCGEQEKSGRISEKKLVFPNWQCDKTAEIVYRVKKAAKHTLRFQFGSHLAYAYNNPDTVSDSFDNETKIAAKQNITISNSQAKLSQSGLNCWGLAGSCDAGCNKSSTTPATVYSSCNAYSCGQWCRPDNSYPDPNLIGSLNAPCYNPDPLADCTGTLIGYWAGQGGYSPCASPPVYDTDVCYECVNPLTKWVISVYAFDACLSHNDNLEVCQSTTQLHWVATGTGYSVSGEVTRYTGAGTCSADGTGSCYKLTAATYYTAGSACGGSGCSSAIYSDRTQCDWYPTSYYSSGDFTSINLLAGISTNSINSFVYNLSAEPTGTGATVQFSQNGTSWYNSAGVLDSSDTLTTGLNNTIDLSGLVWSGPNFYYKIAYTSTGSATPVLDDISVNYSISCSTQSQQILSGYAWSANIGWVSFDCANSPKTCSNGTNPGVPCPNGNECLGGGTCVDTCTLSPYKVAVDSDDYINPASYAWSSDIGWITFDPAVAGSPPAGGYDYTPGHLAKLEKSVSPNELRGWMRACGKPVGGSAVVCGNGGWDGWINLRTATSDLVKVTLNEAVTPKEFLGWAWGGDVVGWLSFNCSNTDTCLDVNYKVTFFSNRAPCILSPQSNQPNYCNCAACPGVSYSWTFADPDPGDTQSARQIQTATSSDFSALIDDYSDNSSSNSYSLWAPKLTYGNNTYYWRVKVWDTGNLPSEWATGASFTTPVHAYPDVDFNYYPLRPSVDEKMTFIDQSQVFSAPATKTWQWTFQDGTPATATSQNPDVKFSTAGAKIVELDVTDADALTCASSTTIMVSVPSPEWREISPLIWLKNSLAAISNAVSGFVNQLISRF